MSEHMKEMPVLRAVQPLRQPGLCTRLSHPKATFQTCRGHTPCQDMHRCIGCRSACGPALRPRTLMRDSPPVHQERAIKATHENQGCCGKMHLLFERFPKVKCPHVLKAAPKGGLSSAT